MENYLKGVKPGRLTATEVILEGMFFEENILELKKSNERLARTLTNA